MVKFIFPKLNLKVERWKWNKEYRVFVSTLGNFKDEHKQNVPIRINSCGYCMIETEYGIKQAHRLVMLTWRPIPNAESYTVDHKNHNKRCNELDNLEWVTREENQKRALNDLYKDNEIIMEKLNTNYLVIKSQKFNNLDAATDWVLTQHSTPDKPETRATIKRNILNAVAKNKKYCNENWILIEKENGKC